MRIAGWALGLSMAVAGVGLTANAFVSGGTGKQMVKADSEPTEGTVTFAQTSTSAASQSGTYPVGATVEFANTFGNNKEQITSGNTQTWTFKGYSGKKITSISAQFKRNSTKGTGTVSLTNNGSDITVVKSSYARADLTSSYASYNIAKSEFICAGDIVFTITGTESSMYCNQVVLAWENNVNYVAESLTLTPESTLVIDGNNAVTTKVGTIDYTVGYDGTAGDGLVNVAIKKGGAATDGLTYSDNNTGRITLTGIENGTYTVTVSTKDKNSSGNPISHDVTVTVQNLLEPTYPAKATDADGLSIGDTVYLVNEGANCAAGAISGSLLTCKTVTLSEGEMTDSGEAVGFVLGRNGDNYTFRVGSNYLGTTAAKSLNMTSSGTTTWTLSFSSGDVEIASTDDSYGSIQYNYNQGNSRFLNYTSNQTAIQLYVLSASDQEVADEFEKTYLVMDKDVEGQCNTYYANAKSTFGTLTQDQIDLLSDEALARLAAWAAAKGDTFVIEDRAFGVSAGIESLSLSNDFNNVPLIITIIAFSAAVAGGYFFLRRRKEN